MRFVKTFPLAFAVIPTLLSPVADAEAEAPVRFFRPTPSRRLYVGKGSQEGHGKGGGNKGGAGRHYGDGDSDGDNYGDRTKMGPCHWGANDGEALLTRIKEECASFLCESVTPDAPLDCSAWQPMRDDDSNNKPLFDAEKCVTIAEKKEEGMGITEEEREAAKAEKRARGEVKLQERMDLTEEEREAAKAEKRARGEVKKEETMGKTEEEREAAKAEKRPRGEVNEKKRMGKTEEEREAAKAEKRARGEVNKANALECACCTADGTESVRDMVTGREFEVALVLGFSDGKKTKDGADMKGAGGGRYGERLGTILDKQCPMFDCIDVSSESLDCSRDEITKKAGGDHQDWKDDQSLTSANREARKEEQQATKEQHRQRILSCGCCTDSGMGDLKTEDEEKVSLFLSSFSSEPLHSKDGVVATYSADLGSSAGGRGLGMVVPLVILTGSAMLEVL